MKGDSGKTSVAGCPEIGCITPSSKGSAPFSVRLPKELKKDAKARAAAMGIDLGQFIRDAVEAALSGTRARRRRPKYDEIRQDLAEIHAAIISCANQVEQNQGLVSDVEHDRQRIMLLRDAVSALLLLARSIGPR